MSEKRSCCCGALPALWWWLLTLLGLPLLFWLMMSSRQNPVEADLTARTTDGLKAASLSDVQVNLEHRGRDAQLTGKVASDAEREQAVKLVQDTYGIRVVDNAIEVAAPVVTAVVAPATATEPVVAAAAVNPEPVVTPTPPATPAVEPSFALLPQDGKWVLQGSLSSQEEINQALAAAEQMYGAGNVVNQLTMGQVAPTAWLASLASLKEVLSGIEQSGLKFANGAFTLMGIVGSDQAKADTFAKVQQVLGNLKVEDQLTVKAPEVVAAPMPEPTPAAASVEPVAPVTAPVETVQVAPATTEPAAIPATTTTPESAPAAPVVAEPTTAPTIEPVAAPTAIAATPEPAVVPVTPTEPAPVVPAITEVAVQPAAPAPVQLTTQQQSCQDQFKIAMNGRQILFETNKAIIKRDSLKLLANIAKIASECQGVLADKAIRVGGHTDNVGADAYNQNLSQERADAVKAYLGQQGLEAGLVQGVGYGETQPIASNDTEAGRAQNRRISFDIIQK